MMDWFRDITKRDKNAVACFLDRFKVMEETGKPNHRPYSATLRDGIYEVRVRNNNVHYRGLFFMHGGMAVMTHGFIKKTSKVPEIEIERAIRRRREFLVNPGAHLETVR